VSAWEILVSHPEQLLLAREATGELPETALVLPELPLPVVTYFRAVVMDGDVHEHAVVLGASALSPELRARVASLLGRRKPTRVAFAEELSPGRYELAGDAIGPRDASLLAAVAYGFSGFVGPAIECLAGAQVFRVSAVLEKRFFRCRCVGDDAATR
jgi:hypothetical protein